MSKLRLIQAGVGGFGGNWVRNYTSTSPDFQVVAIADPNPAALDEAGAVLALPPERRFAGLEAAVASVEADAVLSCTPPAARLEQAQIAFGAGLHLMIEKPFANDIATAIEITRLAAAEQRQLVVSQNYRYSRQAVRLRRAIEAGEIGAVGHGHIDFYIPADFTSTFRETMPHVLLVDMAIHHIDLLRYLIGRNVHGVTATTFHPQWSWYGHNPALKMLLELEDGLHFSYSGDWSARGRNTGWSGDWRIQGETGSLHWSFDDILVARSSRRFKNDTTVQPMDAPALPAEGQAATLASFAQAIRTGVPAPTSGKDNLQSFATVMAAVRSAEERRSVALSEILPG